MWYVVYRLQYDYENILINLEGGVHMCSVYWSCELSHKMHLVGHISIAAKERCLSFQKLSFQDTLGQLLPQIPYALCVSRCYG